MMAQISTSVIKKVCPEAAFLKPSRFSTQPHGHPTQICRILPASRPLQDTSSIINCTIILPSGNTEHASIFGLTPPQFLCYRRKVLACDPSELSSLLPTQESRGSIHHPFNHVGYCIADEPQAQSPSSFDPSEFQSCHKPKDFARFGSRGRAGSRNPSSSALAQRRYHQRQKVSVTSLSSLSKSSPKLCCDIPMQLVVLPT